MAFRIYDPVFLHEIGKRKNNEDMVYPFDDSATTADRLFLVCDGVGGANKGEVASLMICELFQVYFQENDLQHVSKSDLEDALRFVEGKLSEHTQENPDCSGMASTLTLLHLNDEQNVATIGWVGDSRVYHIRAGKILYETEDHSLVNELIKRGEITAEEAKVHPQRNVILRAISGNDNPSQISVHQIENIEAGDFFLLCSDGILESVDERILVTLLPKKEVNLQKVRDKIKELCLQYSHDNNSMYLLQIEDVIEEDGNTGKLKTAPLTLNDTLEPLPEAPEIVARDSNKKLIIGAVTMALIILLALGVYKWLDLREQNQLDKAVVEAEHLAEVDSIDAAINRYANISNAFPQYNETARTRISDLIELRKFRLLEQQSTLRDSLKLAVIQILDQLPDSISVEGFDSITRIQVNELDSLKIPTLETLILRIQPLVPVIEAEADTSSTEIETTATEVERP
ncbi:MAG: PP2C family protein-serine/threonine phosphatase [Chitinophagales bacterium]